MVFDSTGAGTIDVGANLTTGNFTTGGITFNNTAGYDYTFTGNGLGSAGTLTKNNAGVVTFNQANGFSAATLNGGRVNLNHAGALGSGTVTLGNATILGLANSLDFTNPVTLASGGVLAVENGSASASGDITGSGSLTKTGAGTLILSGDNSSHSGGTTVNGGTLSINADKNIGSGTHTLAGGTLQLTGASYGKHWTLGAGSNAIEYNDALDPVTFGGNLTGTGGFTKTGDGTLILTADNSYTGGTTINTGTLQIGNGGATGSVTGDIAINNNARLVFNRSDDALDYAGNVSGTGTLTKEGDGTLTLSGSNNSYSGDTTVNTGILSLTGSLLNSNIKVENDATFDLSGTASQNVTLTSGATFDFSGSVGQNVTLSGGTMNWRGTIGAGGIGGHLDATNSILNFYVPEGTAKDTTLLNVGSANITGSTVHVGLRSDSTPLVEGDSLTLINATIPLTGDPANSAANGTVMKGITLQYEFDLDWTTEPNKLQAKITKAGLNEQTKALSEGYLAGTAFLNQSADFAAGQGLEAALQQAQAVARNNTLGFAAIGGGKLRHNTGSHVDVDGYNLIVGLAASKASGAGDLTAGVFIEHGEGSYDSYNSFSAAKVHGKGDTKYTGGGVLAKFVFNPTSTGQAYIEASARAGKVDTDFRGHLGQHATYDAKSGYLGGHLGGGYLFKLNEQSQLNLYAQYLWTHQGSDSVRLNTGETVKFEAVDSQRTRLGARWSLALSKQAKAYAGAAWEHEYDGQAKASTQGYKIAAPKLRGDTGMLELGVTLNPTATNQAWTLDFGVQGYTGKREGVTGSLKARYSF